MVAPRSQAGATSQPLRQTWKAGFAGTASTRLSQIHICHRRLTSTAILRERQKALWDGQQYNELADWHRVSSRYSRQSIWLPAQTQALMSIWLPFSASSLAMMPDARRQAIAMRYRHPWHAGLRPGHSNQFLRRIRAVVSPGRYLHPVRNLPASCRTHTAVGYRLARNAILAGWHVIDWASRVIRYASATRMNRRRVIQRAFVRTQCRGSADPDDHRSDMDPQFNPLTGTFRSLAVFSSSGSFAGHILSGMHGRDRPLPHRLTVCVILR